MGKVMVAAVMHTVDGMAFVGARTERTKDGLRSIRTDADSDQSEQIQTRASKPLVTQPSATHHRQAPLSSVHLISPSGNYPNMHVHMDELNRKTTYNSCRFTYIIHQFIDIFSAQTNKHVKKTHTWLRYYSIYNSTGFHRIRSQSSP
ncbi:hypothetical protein GQ457_13G018090 [Hibiscus cannabinus]